MYVKLAKYPKFMWKSTTKKMDKEKKVKNKY